MMTTNPIPSSARALLVCGVLFGAFPSFAHGQAGRAVRGTVTTEADGKPVADAVLKVIDPPSGRFTYSSSSGRFELQMPVGEARLLVTRIGYAPDTVTVGSDDRRLDVRLQGSAFALDPITVSAEPTYSAASSRTIREFDIQLRPRETAQELLRLAPGLVIAQHAGGGKAEQIFLRAFDVGQTDWQVCGEASTGREAVEQAKATRS